MNQPVKNQQGQGMYNPASPNRMQPARPGVRPGGMPGGGNMPPAGNRPMQPANRPMQQNMQPQGGRPMQQRMPVQPRQGQPYAGGYANQPATQPAQQPMPQQAYPYPTQSEQPVPSESPIPAETRYSEPVVEEKKESEKKNPYVPNFASDFNLSPVFISSKGVVSIFFIALIMGMIFGGMVFGGGNNAPQVVGLQGVIKNPEIPAKFPRCGWVDKGQACVLYIMNSTKYDKMAEDFFEEAVKLTEVQRYAISMANPKYAKVRIPPGRFVELKIPNVR